MACACAARLRTMDSSAICFACGLRSVNSALQSYRPSLALSGITVKSSPRFPSEPSRRNHFSQQWARAILRIAETAVKYLENIYAGIEANEIGKLERAHRMI